MNEISLDKGRDIIISQGLRFITPSPKLLEQIPNYFNYRAMEEIGVEEDYLKEIIAYFIIFLQSPMIIDKFGTKHAARKYWQGQITKKHGEIMRKFFLTINCGKIIYRLF